MKTTARNSFLALLIACLLPFAVFAAESGVSEAEFAAYKELAQTKLEATKTELQKDREKIEARLDSQDKRIGDLNTTLTEFGILITVLVFLGGLIGFVSVRGKAKEEARDVAQKEAKDAAEQWLNAKGLEAKVLEFERELAESRESIATLMQQLKNSAVQADEHLHDIENTVASAKELEETLARMQADMNKNPLESTPRPPAESKDSAVLEQAAEAVRSKPETEYTFDDWNTRAFDAYRKDDFDNAARYWKSAANSPDATPTRAAQLLFNAGVALGKLNRSEEAIAVYDEVVKRFGEASEPALREQVAKALVNKGVALGQLNRSEEAIAVYDEVIKRFGEASEPALRELVAVAHNSKGFTLFCRAKEHWQDEVARIGDLQTALALFKQAEEANPDKFIVWGNQAYSYFLLGQIEPVRALLQQALQQGGEKLYQATLEDLAIHPVPPDADFRSLLDEVWAEVQAGK